MWAEEASVRHMGWSGSLRMETFVFGLGLVPLLAAGCAAEVGSEDELGSVDAQLNGRPPSPPSSQSDGRPGGVNAWSLGVDEDWSWITLGDLDGDGRDDLCGLYGRDYGCVLNGRSNTFSGAFFEADAFDGVGRPGYHGTIDIVDVDDDGDGDLCGRLSDGIVCQRFTGSGFGAREVWHRAFSDAGGWNNPQYYETIAFVRLHRVTGPGSGPAVCGRGIAGIHCYYRNSAGNAFLNWGPVITAFSDGNGWTAPKYYETIQFADLDGDGFDDVCGRGRDGIWCSRYTDGATRDFEAPSIWTTQFRDSYGWGSPVFYSSIRLGDVNRDGRADICGRGGAGVYCGLSRSWYFNYTMTVDVPGMSNTAGWSSQPLYYASLDLVDYDGDGRKDVCAVGPSTKASGIVVPEIYCARSTSRWSPSFGALGRMTGNAVVPSDFVSGKIHRAASGFCWPSSAGGDVVCTNPF